jgi:cobalt-zinc-cadmium efflux system outer membrane protein
MVLPKAREAADLSAKAFQAGQFTYLQVLVANRAVAEAKLEYVTALTEAWKAAAELSGLLLEENWPARPPKPEPK